MDRAEINKKIEEVKNIFNLEALMNRNIFELSGGEKQKIAIASVFALDPKVFVFDEPSSSLDIDSMRELSKIIEKLKAVSKTIIIAEHRLWYLKNVTELEIYDLLYKRKKKTILKIDILNFKRGKIIEII